MMSLNCFWSPYPFYVGKRLQYKLAQTRKCRAHYNLSLEWNGGHRHKCNASLTGPRFISNIGISTSFQQALDAVS
jgi:hypothetical protein